MNEFLDIDHLRSLNVTPGVFGRGCVEVKLDENQFLYFHHPEVGPPFDDIHDHRHDVVRTVLAGTLTHELLAFEPKDGGGQVMTAFDLGVDKEPVEGSTRSLANVTAVAGSRLFLAHDQLRRTHAARCVVHDARSPARKPVPHRVRSRWTKDTVHPPVIGAARCWEIIADLLGQNAKPGYHRRRIAKGVLGEASKIVEEIEEFQEALEQGVSLMALIELADLQGAVEAYLAKHHPSLGLDDLRAMSEVTKRAFQNGRR